MNKITYLFKRIADIHYKQMFETVKIAHERCKKPSIVIFFDMIYCGFKYMSGYTDYLVFEFYNLNKEQRKTYITRGENNKIVTALNDKNYWDMFEDKAKFNEVFHNYIGRKWLDLRKSTKDDFINFTNGIKKIVVKPIDGICGRGIDIIEIKENTDCNKLYETLMENKQYMVDEFINQHSDLANIYSGSLNTVRMVTILHNGNAEVVFACLRVGNGKKVDNLNSGGMAAVININTGIIEKPAADKKGFAYYNHPATNESFINFKIPNFEKAVELVKNASLVVPQVGYVGWDVAITDEKVCLIEGNHFPGNDIYQFQVQLDNKIGLLPRFKQAMGENI